MKVADFGLARSLIDNVDGSGEANPPVCTDYVATRWYRAPEILTGSTTYSVQVDMWSMGCIFAEMLQGKPVFTGTTTLNQMEEVAKFLGLPTQTELDSLQSMYAKKLFESVNVDQGDEKEGSEAQDGASGKGEGAKQQNGVAGAKGSLDLAVHNRKLRLRHT